MSPYLLFATEQIPSAPGTWAAFPLPNVTGVGPVFDTSNLDTTSGSASQGGGKGQKPPFGSTHFIARASQIGFVGGGDQEPEIKVCQSMDVPQGDAWV